MPHDVDTPKTHGNFTLTAFDRVGNTKRTLEFSVFKDFLPPAVTQTFDRQLKTTKSYLFGSQRVAMRVLTDNSDAIYYLHGDHLGSVSMSTDTTGQLVSQARYTPFGGLHWESGAALTDFGFTGQRAERGMGLMDYNARFYAASLGRFVSADTLVPGAGNPMAWDRYGYVMGNPLNNVDPSGHRTCTAQQAATGDETCDQNASSNSGDFEPTITIEDLNKRDKEGRRTLTPDELLVLALLLTGESSSGKVPFDITLMKAWVFLNKMAFDYGKGRSLYTIWRGLEGELIDTDFGGDDWEGLADRADLYRASDSEVGDYFRNVLNALPSIVNQWVAKGGGSEFDPTKGAITFAEVPETYPNGTPIDNTSKDAVEAYRQYVIGGHERNKKYIPDYNYIVTDIYALDWGSTTTYAFTSFRTYIPP